MPRGKGTYGTKRGRPPKKKKKKPPPTKRKKGYWMKIFLWILGGGVIIFLALGIIYIAAMSRIH